MAQNRESGAEAARFGLEAAAKIGERIGARKLTRNSNEFEYNGQSVTIRTAHKGTTDVGFTYKMLERIELVIGAFEVKDNEFDLLSLSPETFKNYMRDSTTGKGRGGLVRRN